MRKTGMDTKISLCDMIFLKKRVLVDINVAEEESKGELTFHSDKCHNYGLAEGWFEFYGSGRLFAQLLRSCMIIYNIRELSTKGAIAFPWFHLTQIL